MKLEALEVSEKEAFQGTPEAWDNYRAAMVNVGIAAQAGASNKALLGLPATNSWLIYVSDERILEWARAIRKG